MSQTTTAETSPLLGPSHEEDSARSYHIVHISKRRVITVCFIMAVLIDCAGIFLHAPQTNILEGIICKQMEYDDCTAARVQSELAIVDQMFKTFIRIPGLIVAMPLGVMADRRGRRPVVLLCILGYILQDILAKVVLWWPNIFSPRLIWLSAAANLVGGGQAVASFIVYLIVADVSPPAQRASLFFLVSSFGYFGEAVGTPLSAVLMAKNPWIPYFIYSAILCSVAFLPLFFLPETLQTPTGDANATCDECTPQDTQEQIEEAASKPTETSLLSRFRPLINRNIVAVLLAYFIDALGRSSTDFFVQYVRQRFRWEYDRANMLMTIRALANLAVLVVGLPLFIRFLTCIKIGVAAKDLLISRLSVTFCTFGILLIGIAPAVPLLALGMSIFSLGSGFAPAARSIATAFVHPDETGRLYSALAIMQSGGALTSGPLLALSFRWGLSLGPSWSGLPFAFVAILYSIGIAATALVRIEG